MEEWTRKEEILQASAFRQLRNALQTPEINGLRTVKDVQEFIKGQETSIYNVIGDCPVD